ncbi:hypothetical protein VNO77_06487 [Canavalia gladiata]|uniref:Epidermal patterning factor-like protein n=1 Tax=Canavalia gladiata TaxID=3824 RepID=A0AAN9M6N6_CANGL
MLMLFSTSYNWHSVVHFFLPYMAMKASRKGKGCVSYPRFEAERQWKKRPVFGVPGELSNEARRPFLPAQEEALQSSPAYTIESNKGFMGIKDKSESMSKIGSSPPSCEHKCYGCVPCEAIQVPSTNSRRSHLGIQYANYEPESWKCKCGPSFYSP